jgi:hypothetical protein
VSATGFKGSAFKGLPAFGGAGGDQGSEVKKMQKQGRYEDEIQKSKVENKNP